jgi:hypothetical protein
MYSIRSEPMISVKMNTILKEIDVGLYEFRGMDSADWNNAENILMHQLKLTKLRMTYHILPMIRLLVGKQILLWTFYVGGGILDYIIDKLSKEGKRIGIYRAEPRYKKSNEKALNDFRWGNIDVLISGRSISTGVDELQNHCSHLITNGLPQSYASWEQLTGRLYRKGQRWDVNVLVPLIRLRLSDTWVELDKRDWMKIQSKKSIAYAAIEGRLPLSREERDLISDQETKRHLDALIQRIEIQPTSTCSFVNKRMKQ